MQRTKEQLADIGFVDLGFRGNHKLLSLDSAGALIKDDDELLEVRICNFELFKRL